MKRRFDSAPPRRPVFIISCILLWAAVLAAILISGAFDKTEPAPVFGSLEGRFESDVAMELDGRTLHYRENEITNYLIIGTDADDLSRASGADFLVILAIDRANRTVTPVLLDRDSMTQARTYGASGQPDSARTAQLRLAQTFGDSGGADTVQAVEKMLHGIKIDCSVVLDTAAVPLVNEAVGGVEITLEDDFSGYDPAMVRGKTLHLTDAQAEFLAHGSAAAGTSPTEGQRQLFSALLARLRQTAEGDASALSRILTALHGHAASDAAENQILPDMTRAMQYDWLPLRTPEGTHISGEDGSVRFHADEDSLKRLAADIWFR